MTDQVGSRAGGGSGCRSSRASPSGPGRDPGTGVAGVQGMEALTAELAHHGLRIVFSNVLLQQIGVPIPAEPTLVVAGSLASRHVLSGSAVALSALTAIVIADLAWFAVGRWFGGRVLRFIARLLRAPGNRVDPAAKRTFARWGLRWSSPSSCRASRSCCYPWRGPRALGCGRSCSTISWAGPSGREPPSAAAYSFTARSRRSSPRRQVQVSGCSRARPSPLPRC